MLVTSVGMSTIRSECNEQTPLQGWLNKLTSAIGKIVRYFTGNTKDENGNTEFNGSNTKVDDIIISVVGIVAAAVTIVVVAIPGGLPLAVTFSLAYSMKRMMADQAMVRKLSAYKTMRSATTLTLNQMQGTKFWLGRESMQERSSTSISDNILELLHQGVCLNTTGSVYRSTSGSEFKFFGSLLKRLFYLGLSWELNMDIKKLKRSFSILHVEAFNSRKKRSGISMRKKDDNTINMHWKGAAEMESQCVPITIISLEK
ncbi:hypothetical protein ACSBR1_013508 [Camellia fascicularis]